MAEVVGLLCDHCGKRIQGVIFVEPYPPVLKSVRVLHVDCWFEATRLVKFEKVPVEK